MTPAAVERLFIKLDQRFFAARLSRDRWRVRLVPELQAHAFCYPLQKLILLNASMLEGARLSRALTHEMGHASSGDITHGPQWQAEMQRVAAEGAPVDDRHVRTHAHFHGFAYVRRIGRPPHRLG
jgi:hypothetical protein